MSEQGREQRTVWGLGLLAVALLVLVVVVMFQPIEATCRRACAASTDVERCVELCVGK